MRTLDYVSELQLEYLSYVFLPNDSSGGTHVRRL